MAEKEYIEREEVREAFYMEFDEDYADDITDRLPASDVQEVRHGKWIYDCSDIGWANYKCSSCGECFVLEAGTPQENEYNFCPHCGAKMDKE